MMADSQQVAQAVAERALGMKVRSPTTACW